MHAIHYTAPEATVYGWADPITGYVWETVYNRQQGWESTAVFTEQQADWAPHEHPHFFAGRHVGDQPCLPHINVRGENRAYSTDYRGRHIGPMALIDYGNADAEAEAEAERAEAEAQYRHDRWADETYG